MARLRQKRAKVALKRKALGYTMYSIHCMVYIPPVSHYLIAFAIDLAKYSKSELTRGGTRDDCHSANVQDQRVAQTNQWTRRRFGNGRRVAPAQLLYIDEQT